MESKIRVWLDDDRDAIHHAAASNADDMTDVHMDEGRTDCGRIGALHLVHHENVDMGRLCPECQAISGVRPPLAGQDLGPA